jgi:uncharacterized protein YgiM (DUF1202 family)
MNKNLARLITKLVMALLLLGIAGSCVHPPPISPPESSFFLSVETAYLRDNPGYGGNVLGQLYQGDEVKILDLRESGWWRIELLRSGQQGWVQKELLSPTPVRTVFYYVNRDSFPLLECPRNDCLRLQVLFRGDQVQRVEEGERGWWHVLAVKSRSLGWVPSEVLAETIQATKAGQMQKPYYYVKPERVRLRAKPSANSEIVRILKFNDQVQKIEAAPGWLKVRQPSSGAVGWIASPDLDPLPGLSPTRVRPAKEKEEPEPFQPKEEPEIEPEFM